MPYDLQSPAVGVILVKILVKRRLGATPEITASSSDPTKAFTHSKWGARMSRGGRAGEAWRALVELCLMKHLS